jgi:hypothetical protein
MKVRRPHSILITANGTEVKIPGNEICQFKKYLQVKIPRLRKAIIKIKIK